MSSETSPVRVAVIGAGQRGKAQLRAYGGVVGVDVAALVDIDEAEAQRVAKEFDIPDVHTDFRDVLARDDIQAVDVILHNNLHTPVTVAALEAGKDVYCEKPMAGSYIDAKAMLDAANAQGRKLSIQLGSLFSKECRAGRLLIDGGHLGDLYHARSTGFRRRGRPYVDGYGTPTFVQKEIAAGGALYDMGVYHIAEVLYLLGNPEVERITGKTYQQTPMDKRRREASGYDVEELGVGFIRFAGGLSLDIVEAWAIHLDGFEGSYVVGSQAGIRLRPFGFYTNLGDMELNGSINLDGAAYRWQNVYEDGGVYDSPQQHWIAALQGRVELLPTAEVALTTMLIQEGIYLSERLGREVTKDEVAQESQSTGVAP